LGTVDLVRDWDLKKNKVNVLAGGGAGEKRTKERGKGTGAKGAPW